ncbi:hypothetical protein R50073_39260 [Maricurvus nonylphenolicus]|uniref:DUF3080 family protein n=1 Tax=Maricurvus nonylphenolicus TaxID=1008307 RepID=UPI0036F37EF0
MNRCAALGLIIVILGLLTSCTQRQGLNSLLDNYHYRLSNVFEFEPSNNLLDIDENSLPSYPSRRELQQPLSPVSVNLLEFLRLSRCDLQRLIGERNSSLGKFMPDSQMLVYHLRFIALAKTCRDTLVSVDNHSLAQAVADARQTKINDLPKVRWNASFASQEFQQLFSHAAPPLTLTETASDSAALTQALRYLQQFLLIEAEDTLPSFTKLESHYAVVASDKFIGRLLRSQLVLVNVLSVLSDQIELANKERPLCPAGSLTPRGKVMQQVFLRFYIGEIQPYISGIYRQSRDVKQVIEDYLLLWPEYESQVFSAYWQQAWSDTQPTSIWQQYNRAVSRHTQVWQQQLQACGLRPGNNQINGK